MRWCKLHTFIQVGGGAAQEVILLGALYYHSIFIKSIVNLCIVKQIEMCYHFGKHYGIIQSACRLCFNHFSQFTFMNH